MPLVGWGQTNIEELSSINDPNGHYVITKDIIGGKPEVTTFNGILEANIDPNTNMPFRIKNLSVPLFTTLTGTVKNLVLEDVNIPSNTGNTGAVACTANGSARIYNVGILSGRVGGTAYTGGLVGLLDEKAHVVNCYSYATITGGTSVGGIVGYNNVSSSQANIDSRGILEATIVMNCVFYGDITGGTTVSPVYGGKNINNLNSGGLTTFNYYAYSQLKTKPISDGKYNCALAIEERFLVHFELYRELLNSNKKLAAIYASTSTTTVSPDDMAKWVLEKADRNITTPKPYPVLKQKGKYPSIVNIDAEHAIQLTLVNGRPSEGDRNKGGKLAELSVTISAPGGWTNAPSNAKLLNADGDEITTSRTITLNRTDKDESRFNFNYDKIQLPYYNDYGTKNYTSNKVVTGWKITSITNGTPGTFTAADEWGGYNFADRKCTNKDLYGTGGSNRVFSQGAYFDVPYGVTAITIEPYWGNAAYVSDQYYDVVYKAVSGQKYNGQNVEALGVQVASNDAGTDMTINGDVQKVFTTIEKARASLSIENTKTVYDYAVVLVGNVHQVDPLSGANSPYTIMSVDLDKDNEPDHSFIFTHYQRQPVSPIRFDFLNVIGCAEAQKPNMATIVQNVSIFNPKGWFEVTNTCIMHFTQFECDNTNYANSTKVASPVILLGGAFDQITSTQKASTAQLAGHTQYIHVGSNVWFKSFGNGTHSDGTGFTPHVPISVTGGDFEEFYLTGTYQPKAESKPDDAECYISGGRFGEAAGAAQEKVDGNVQWQIYEADIENFFGGGINADKAITGKIEVDIFNSQVTTYCGGPKFGDMSDDKPVTTRANGCVFRNYFGAGFGGTSYVRVKYFDATTLAWDTWQTEFSINGTDKDRGKYFNGTSSATSYGKKGPGVATDFDYEFFVWSSGVIGGRFYVKFATFSLAQTNDVNSTLTNCTINENFYGGGSLGKVLGTATSVLDDCTVNGNVFGGGYSARIPIIPVRNTGFDKNPNYNIYSGMFEPGIKSGSTDFNWIQGTLPSNNTLGIVETGGRHDVITDKNLQTLGQANHVNLTLQGSTSVAGNVYGGGDESATNGNCIVTLQNSVTVNGNVYGGGNEGPVQGNSEVRIQD